MASASPEYPFIHAKSSLMSAREQLNIASQISAVGIKEGSIDSYMQEGTWSQYLEEIEQDYPTKGYNLLAAVPVFFSLANAAELTIRAFNYFTFPEVTPKPGLKLADAIAEFKHNFPEQTVLLDFIDKWLDGSKVGGGDTALFGKFLLQNELTPKQFFDTRRYLSNTNLFTVIEKYQPIHHTAEEGKQLYTAIKNSVTPVLDYINPLERDISEDGVTGDKVNAIIAQHK